MKEFEINLKDIHFYSYHGVMSQESKVGNEFTVNLSIRIPYSDDILKDDLEATISYADLYDIVAEEMASPKKLLETVAAQICKRCYEKWDYILGGEITICKSAPPIRGITGQSEVRLFF